MGLRVATEADIPACVDIFYTAFNRLHLDHGMEPEDPAASQWLHDVLAHLQATDPELQVVWEEHGSTVGFGSAIRRDDYWFLSFLFVMPDAQASGIGRSLLTHVLPDPAAGCELATVIESFQPVSTALYAGYGMTPRAIRYVLSGVSGVDGLPSLPDRSKVLDITQVDPDAVDALDRSVLGFARRVDHRWWSAYGMSGWACLRGGEVVGYAYLEDVPGEGIVLAPSVGSDESTHTSLVAEVLRRSEDPAAVRVAMYGHSGTLMQTLLGAGARIDAPSYRFLYCSSRRALPPNATAYAGYLP